MYPQKYKISELNTELKSFSYGFCVGCISNLFIIYLNKCHFLQIHCINEVECRGLSEQGIYRVPGSEKEVRELKEKFFKGKGIPSLVSELFSMN